LEQRSWEQDGQKRSKLEVIVEDFNFGWWCAGWGRRSGRQWQLQHVGQETR